MSYNAYITRIKNVRKHSNADRLLVGECFGNYVIVDLKTQEGDLGIYFPTDGRIGLEFANENNLLRKNDENGNNIGGYMDAEKRNVTSIKLRGEKSDGLFLSISSLSKFTDISTLKEGDMINVLNGIVICEKYIPRGKVRNSQPNQNKKSKKIEKETYPFFEQHIDTSQLAYNLNQFKKGDLCYITLKMHGCFNSTTRVKLWGESKAKKISEVKVGDTVIGLKDGKLVPSKVLNTYRNGKTKYWNEIQITRNPHRGEKISKIKCTPNHLFWDEYSSDYIEAKDLKAGKEIVTVAQSKILNRQQKEILLGKYLGDGYYFDNVSSGEVQFSHKKDDEDYVDYTLNSLGDIAYKTNRNYLSGYGTLMVRAKTFRIPDIALFFNDILSIDNNNKLSEKIIEYFTPITLAFLYMDDGSLGHSETQKDRTNFAICDYNDHDANIIKKCLENLGLNAVIYKDTEGFNRIRLNTEDAYKMFDMINCYIPLSMSYKLPKEYSDRKVMKLSNKATFGYVKIKNKIVANNEIVAKKGWEKYDIHTETENYVVHDLIVHNSSQRISHTIKEKKSILPHFIHKLLKKTKLNINPKRTWEYISGTRRVTLKDYKGGFYGDNQFRKQWHDYFTGKLHKGESVYFEVVGFNGNDKTIMPECDNKKTKDKEFIKQYGKTTKFTYGCNNGESDIYVYRMTMTNEDGHVVEYPWSLVKLRCEQMGVKYCPEFEQFIFTTQEDLMERVDKYLEGVDPIGKNHTREGVVVRIDNKEKFAAFKHKSWYFKVLEGIIKSEDVLDIEEEESQVEAV